MGDSNGFLPYALRYAALGWHIFPCKPASKAPDTQHGFKDASDNALLINAWWSKSPTCNIGVACDRFFILDMDPRNGGRETLEDLEETHGRLPDTLQQVTGGGGRQYWFNLPLGDPPKNSSGEIGRGLDIKAPGGYVVLPPSIHPETKRPYIWDGTKEIEQQPVADAPEWLIKLIRSTAKSTRTDPDSMERIPDGKRHAALLAYAGRLRHDGLDYDEIAPALLAMNNRRCVTPAPTRDVEKICRDVTKYAPSEISDTRIKRLAIEILKVTDPQEAITQPCASDDWRSKLSENLHGVPKKTLANSLITLQLSPDYNGAFRFNQFSETIEFARDLCGGRIKAGAALTDRDASLITAHLQDKFDIDNPTSITREAIDTIARDYPYHPVRDYLESLTWDGDRRVDRWLSDYLGVKPSSYAAAAGRNWLISGVARVFHSVSKVDTVLILEGKQGIGKSSALRIMGVHWFSNCLANIGDKDACLQLRGKWIIEIPELHAISKADLSRAKSFITTEVDNYRPPYGRMAIDVPRQVIFAGSTNESVYLNDEENRRFWPILCSEIDLDGLATVRDQLWAEAYRLFLDGSQWHLPKELVEEARVEQDDRHVDDSWLSTVADYCDGRIEVSAKEILVGPLGLKVGELNKSVEMRLAPILNRLGWERQRVFRSGIRQRIWVCKPE